MRPANPYASALAGLRAKKVEFIVIGVSGINYYAGDPGRIFATQDFDLLIKPAAANLLAALKALSGQGFELSCNGELVVGLDRELARTIIERRAVITAAKDRSLRIDLVLDAGGIPFHDWEMGARVFKMGRAQVTVGSLVQLIRAKENSNRKKDRAFLSLYKIQLGEMIAEADLKKGK